MDGRNFDELAKTLVTDGRSRRGFLALMGGGLAAALGGRQAARANHRADHCAAVGEKPKPHKACCGGLAPVDGRCAPVVRQGTCQGWVSGCSCLTAPGVSCGHLGCPGLHPSSLACLQYGMPCICSD